MQINRKSVITGIWRTREINIKPEDYETWEKGYANINEVMPYLNESDRDFILGGVTESEWKTAMSETINNIVNDKF